MPDPADAATETSATAAGDLIQGEPVRLSSWMYGSELRLECLKLAVGAHLGGFYSPEQHIERASAYEAYLRGNDRSDAE